MPELDLDAIKARFDAPHNPLTCGKRCWKLAHEDAPALLAEVERLQAKLARDHDELRDKRTDLLNIRGILKPADRMEPVVPMPLGHMVAPAVEWLADERDKALDALSDYGRGTVGISGHLADGIDADHRVAAAERDGLLEEIANLRAALTERGRM